MEFGLLSVSPAIVAIVLAVLTRNVVLSLFGALALAGTIAVGGNVFGGLAHALHHTHDGGASGIVGAVADVDHAKTMLFTLLIGGMVGVIGKSGATRAVVAGLAKRAKSPRSVQVLSWFSGMIVFFDDYANCMIVGSAMGPLYDRYRVPRDKLAYIVDSTAAPVASLALVSTWVGFEVGVIDKGLKAAGQTDIDAYGFFLQGWPYRFYPIIAMLFVGMVAFSGRDFGPMRRARSVPPKAQASEGEDGSAPWWVAMAPVVTLVAVTLWVLWSTGSAAAGPGAPLFVVLQNSDGYGAILLGSFYALLLALCLVLATRSLKLSTATEAALQGMRLMFEALVVLVLAWSLSAAMKELGAPAYLVSVLAGALPAALLPTLVFVVGAAVSFAVGSSYATMGIMMPMVIPLAYQVAPDNATIVLASSGSVLAGACFGDHCSPISDTTVLSAMGSGTELLGHVRTQLPYALAVGTVSILFGTLPAGYGVDPWLCLVVGLAVSWGVLRFFGKPAEAVSDNPAAALSQE